MKPLDVIAIAIIGSLIAVQAGAEQLPISTDGSDPKTWDSKTDGPLAAPENHKVIFENDNIRIMSVTVLPGAKEPYHSHLRCSVLVYDSPAQSRDYDAKGNLSPRVSLAAIPWLGPDASNRPPLVFVQPPQAPHSIVNNDTHALHLTRIELKNGCESPPSH